MLQGATDSTPRHDLTYRPAEPGRSVGLHRWALATIAAMFPLIWFGGLTTSHGAGMAVPDWPNTYGYNMFAVPWDVWLGESAGGIFFEHTHRLLGSLAGLFAVAATLWAWGPSRHPDARRAWGWVTLILAVLAIACFVLMRADVAGQHRNFGHATSGFAGLGVVALFAWLAREREPRPWARWLAVGLLGAIIVQGTLGGLRVTEVNLHLAVIHGVFAQVTLCVAGLLVVVTSEWWLRTEATGEPSLRRLLTASAALTLVVFAQLVVAAMMRHYQAGLAVPDFPLSYGQVLPPVSSEGLERANDLRIFDYALPPTTLGQIWLHTTHRIGAVLVTAAVIGVWLRGRRVPSPVRPSGLIQAIIWLLVLQVCLGVATVWMAKPADVATAHVATGALILLLSWVLTVRVARRYGLRPAGDATRAAEPRQSAANGGARVPVSA